MIERFREDTDITSILGKSTLIAGTAYGLHKTYKEAPRSVSDPAFFRRSLGERRVQNRAPEIRESLGIRQEELLGTKGGRKLGSSSFIDKLLKRDFRSGYSKKTLGSVKELENMLKGGYKGRSKELYSMVEAITSSLDKSARIDVFSYKGQPASLNISGGGIEGFKLPLTMSNNKILLGQTATTSPSAFVKNAEGFYTTAVEG